MKMQILAAIGEKELRPLTSLNAALAANDRIKFGFSLLQMALSHAEHPDDPPTTLKQERIACGIDDPHLDNVIREARMIGNRCHINGAAQIVVRIADDMRAMAAPVLAAKPNGTGARLDGLLRALPAVTDDLLDPSAISAITQVSDAQNDSLDQLVMDLHKQLNVMQADFAEESLDGAAAYNLTEADRPLVLAFMKGLNRTAEIRASTRRHVGRWIR
jgi:hypothetical protein